MSNTLKQQAKLAVFGLGLICQPVSAAILSFSSADFTTTPAFSSVNNFSFTIDLQGPLSVGVFNNPLLNSVTYNVSGDLADGTPSGFPAFALQRTMTGGEFYGQGSSLNFEIAAGSDLNDGLQISDLAGSDPVFVFDAREFGQPAGRYHPPLVQLNADGSGTIQNSNNVGGTNPQTMQAVDVDFGEEYVTDLSFNPSQLTLAAPVPLPGALLLFGSAGLLGLRTARRRRPSHAYTG